jgi:hypothetical protein
MLGATVENLCTSVLHCIKDENTVIVSALYLPYRHHTSYKLNNVSSTCAFQNYIITEGLILD